MKEFLRHLAQGGENAALKDAGRRPLFLSELIKLIREVCDADLCRTNTAMSWARKNLLDIEDMTNIATILRAAGFEW